MNKLKILLDCLPEAEFKHRLKEEIEAIQIDRNGLFVALGSMINYDSSQHGGKSLLDNDQVWIDAVAAYEAAKRSTCKTCGGEGGWESCASSTSYFWKECPDCPAPDHSEQSRDMVTGIGAFQQFKSWTAIHLKTGNEYEVIGEAIDATNAASNRHMVIYTRSGKTFVRCASEFMDKFKAKETRTMATASYPCGSLGEPVESEGGEHD